MSNAGTAQRSHKKPRPRHALAWQEKAACVEAHDPDIFFNPNHYQQALQFCHTCPVVLQCRLYSKNMGPGVWGGQIQTGQTQSADNRPYLASAHGTEAGYKRHRRRGEEACHACMEGHSEARRRRGKS